MNYLEIEPARAKSGGIEKLWSDPTWVAEEKLDGWRFLIHFGGDLERAYMTGRRISDVTGKYSEKGLCVPCLWPKWDDCGYTVIDGEVMPPTSFRDIAGIMNVDPEQARARIAEIGEPTYHAFDLLFLNGKDIREVPWLHRKLMLEKLVPELSNTLIQVTRHTGDKKSMFDSVISCGGEGVILKDISGQYGEGWKKAKREHTLDVVITGFTEARFGRTGRIFGQVGALVVSVYLGDGTPLEVAQVSGMDDATRRHITDNKDHWLGKVIEITAQEWAKDRLRHPRFLRARPEANPRDCTYEKMMRDLGKEGGLWPNGDKQMRLL